jgi:hypothetical protein
MKKEMGCWERCEEKPKQEKKNGGQRLGFMNSCFRKCLDRLK